MVRGLREIGHTVQAPDEDDSGPADGRASSHVWGNLQTVLWNRAEGTLEAGSDPRNPAGAGKLQPAKVP